MESQSALVQIELNIERDRAENTRLMMLCDQGEALYERQMAQQTDDEMSFKRASENAKVIARNRDEINLMITALKSKIDRKHVLSTTLKDATQAVCFLWGTKLVP